MEQVFHQYHVAVTSGKFAAVQTYQTERYMNQVFVPVIAHFMDDFEPLRKVQVLVQSGQVDTFIEVICFLAVQRSCDVTGCVECAAVFTDNQARRHVLVFQIDNHCPFAFFQQTFFFQFIHNGCHFVVIEAFTGVCVEFNAQHIVNTFKFFDTDVIEPFPQCQGFVVAILHFYKPQTCFVVQFRRFFRFIMEFYINAHQFLNAFFFNGFFAAPFFVSNDKFTELCAPVAQMVNAYAFVAQLAVNLVQCVADNGRTQMTYMERLCDVGRGVVDNDGLTCAHVAFAVVFFFCQDSFQYLFGIEMLVHKEVDICANDFDISNEIGFFQFFTDFLCDEGRRFPQYLCQFKARVRKVPHVCIGRHFDGCRDFFRCHAAGCGQAFCDFQFHIHITFLRWVFK